MELVTPAGAVALSNMPEEGEPAPGPGGLVRHRYARSPAMSTYLVAARPPRARRPAPAASASAERCASGMRGCSASMCTHMLRYLLQLADTAARPAHAPAHIYQAGWLRPAVPAQFVAGNLTSVERSLPHPGAGAARPLRVWGTPNRCAPAGPPTLNPRRRAPAGCRVGIFGVH